MVYYCSGFAIGLGVGTFVSQCCGRNGYDGYKEKEKLRCPAKGSLKKKRDRERSVCVRLCMYI